MLAKTLVLLASVALASAGPIKARQDGAGCIPRPTTSSPVPPATPTLPLTGGATELPQPPADVVLKHIALGHGIQNYTCTGVTPDGPAVTAVAAGALAALYDATSFYPGQSPDSLSISDFEALTTNVLWTQPLPLNSDGVTPFGASSDPFPAPVDLVLPGLARPLPLIGHHFFDATVTPRFAVGTDELFIGKRLNGTTVPTTADPGPEKTGAVAWLFLGDKGGSTGITYIYRVTTAGGNPHPCKADGGDSVPYTAYYWMFGPKA